MKLHAPAFGVTCGLSLGAAICGMTIIAARRRAAGSVAGKTLGALGVLPGYTVTMSGAWVGLGWGLGLGLVGGIGFALVYNVVAGILGGNKG